jgi:hypothetical protein
MGNSQNVSELLLLEFVSLLDPECTVVQIKTLRNEEETNERKMIKNDNYMNISDKEEEREAKKNKNKCK